MKKELNQLLQSLIKIDSQNPPGNERKIIQFISKYLKNLGIRSRILEFKKDRLNLVGKITAKKSRKAILFTPHVDTVPATGKWRYGPLKAEYHQGKIYGRGATDCKVNVCVALGLLKEIKKKKIKLNNLDLVFAFSADEETGSKFGIIPLMKFLKNIDYAVALDADEFKIVVAQKGALHLRVEIFGKEAHGAYPERGINAIEKSVNILKEIKEHYFPYKAHPLLKRPTLNVGRFCGGDKVNIVAGHAFFELDIRYLPSMKKEKIIKDIERIIKKQKVRYKIKVLVAQEPLEIEKKSFLIRLLKEVLKENKIRAKLTSSSGATVLNFLKDKGMESFAFGFGSQGQAHQKNEYVKADNLDKGVLVLKDYLKKLDAYLNQ